MSYPCVFFLQERGPIFAEARREDATLIKKGSFRQLLLGNVCVCTSWLAECLVQNFVPKETCLDQKCTGQIQSEFRHLKLDRTIPSRPKPNRAFSRVRLGNFI
jgi:hypothetical protein